MGIGTKFSFKSFLDLGCHIVGVFQGRFSVHTKVYFDCDMIAYAACAKMVRGTDFIKRCYDLKNLRLGFFRKRALKKFVHTWFDKVDSNLDYECTDHYGCNRVKDAPLFSEEDGTADTDQGSD